MKKYQAVFFDLCGTLMQYRLDRLPLIEVDGMQVESTTPLTYACFREFDRGQISFEKFYKDFMLTSAELEQEKSATGKEFHSSVRFDRFLDRLDADLGPRRREIHRLLMDIHLDKVGQCLELLPRHKELLFKLKDQYRMAVVSNFDDLKTVQSVLARDGISDLFEIIVVSAEVGLRKPRKEVFMAASDVMKTPHEETLFVGDSWTHDIEGAKKLGMATAWINSDHLPPPTKTVQTDYTLSDLSELSRIL